MNPRPSASGSRERDRIARAQRRAGDDVDGLVGEGAAIARRAPIGREMNREAALHQRRRQRLGRKQMTAGPAGRDQHRRAGRLGHQMPRRGEHEFAGAARAAVRG